MSSAARRQKPKGLVIGGAGFVGQHLVEQLIEQGQYSVSVADLRDPGLPAATFVSLDIRDKQQVAAACLGMDVVFHCATAAPQVQNASTRAIMHAVNVLGTQNVIAGCVQHGVPKLVYTSSASVVFAGKDLLDIDETAPYPVKPLDYYTQSKIEGEKLILAANGTGKLATCAMRPSYIYGEYDRVFIPTVISKAKEGKMKYRFGQGIMMPTYAGNAAQAHIQAAEALTLDSPLAGRAYFTTDSAPRPFWQFLGDILEPLGYERPHIPLPGLLIWVLAWIFQYLIVPLMRPIISIHATEFSPERIAIVLCKRVLRNDNAYRDFGYEPKISTDEGIRKTAQYFKHLRKE